ncbi:MAG: hypothetical protein F7B18_04630 [Desulfurococcales archaeon]|nr:hypothetical protein [Desulfurococcales archaeon]
MDSLLTGMLATFLLNLPFGYWRAHAKSMNNRKEWFLAIHAPVPLVIVIRLIVGAGIRDIPLFVAAFFLGQLVGGRVYRMVSSQLDSVSRCMPCDLAKMYRGSG